jgi:hypothetical protein
MSQLIRSNEVEAFPIPRTLWMMSRLEWWLYRRHCLLLFIAGLVAVGVGAWCLWSWAGMAFALGVLAVLTSWVNTPDEPQQEPHSITDL